MNGVVTASLVPERGVRRRQDESQLQRAVHQFLIAALPASAVHFAVPNGLMRSKIARARAQGEAVRAGVPDLCVIASGRPIFIELKSAKGVVSAAQKETQRRLIYAGADVCLCRSVEQVEASLLEIGVPLRGRLS